MRLKSTPKMPTGLLIALCQMATAKPIIFLMRWRGSYSIEFNRLKVSSDQKYVIAANHQSRLDPFVIFAALPKKLHKQFAPIKFMIHPKLYHKWYIKPFLFCLGCYPAHIKERAYHTYGVSGSIKLLQAGYNICIFPEGRRTLRSESQPKSGVCRILQDFPQAKLLLAHLEWTISAQGKKHLKVIFAPAPENLDITNSNSIMEAIYAL